MVVGATGTEPEFGSLMDGMGEELLEIVYVCVWVLESLAFCQGDAIWRDRTRATANYNPQTLDRRVSRGGPSESNGGEDVRCARQRRN
jgi:hypothetical protein